MSTPIADAAARRRACTEFAKPLVVVAGAGTGKTTTLVARVATWLVGPGWDEAATDRADERVAARALDGVLAITFTKAAAAEMDARVRSALRALESGELPTGVLLPGDAERPDEIVRARAKALRLALDRPLATTIHGYCQGLLAEHPFESGVAPGFAIDADGELVAEHARRAAADDLAASFGGARRDEDWLRLARDGVGPDAVATCVAALRVDGVRSADLEHDPASDATLSARIDALEPAARTFAPHARALAALKGAERIARAAESALELVAVLAAREHGGPADTARAIAAIGLDDLVERIDGWIDEGFGSKADKALGADEPAARAAVRALRPVLLPLARFDVDAFRARRAIVRRVLARAEELGDAAAVVTFGDLLARAAHLVETDRGVRDRLRRRTKQILVDEFQDTDDVQVRIVRALALGEGPGPPGLFLVGDPKQSIYGFRGADLAAYDGFVAEALRSGDGPLELVQNFRSTPRVLDAVRRFVEPVMIAERGVQPPFQALVPIGAASGPEVELWTTWARPPAAKTGAATTVGAARRLEAAELVRSLRARAEADERLAWRDVAILSRSRTGLDACFEALRAAGIPYQVEGDRSYYRRREVVDAAAILGAIVDPGDTLSLVAYLRSSACGLPDAVLEALWASGFATDAQLVGGRDGAAALARIVASADAIEQDLASSGFPGGRGIPHFAASLRHALESLAVLRASLVEDTADRFVERLRALVLFEATESARYQGRFRAANLERFVRRVREALDESGDATAVLRALRRSIEEKRDAKEARPAADVENAVRFLTIHGAKGLEFDAVYVIGLASDRNAGDARDGYDRTTRALRVCGAASPNWAEVADTRARRDAAERARLLYVAMTRAKTHLALSAVWNEAPKLRAARDAKSFRDLAEHGLPADFGVRAAAALHGAERTYRDEEFVVRIACEEVPGDHAARAPVADAGRVERAQRDAETLARHALASAARMERARVASASGAAPFEPGRRDNAASRGEARVGALERDDARLTGVLVHAALELAPDFAAARARLERDAENAGASPAIRTEALAVLDAAASGPLGARLRGAPDTIAARELPLLAPARPGDAAIEGWTGSADLVLRDGERWTVVDFKTEALDGRDPRDAARAHARQLDLYARAVREALALSDEPRREVWFLRDGVVGAVD